MSVDPRGLLDQRVLIIGKGNSAFETADNLIETPTLIHVAGPTRSGWPGGPITSGTCAR